MSCRLPRHLLSWNGLAVFTALILCMPFAHACINAIGTDNRGHKFEPMFDVGDDLARSLARDKAENYWLRNAVKITADARKDPDLKHLTDLAIVLVHQGQHAHAIRLLLSLEKRYPGRHETAGNLGTALELAGHDAVALKWIRIGIHRNVREHYGTEWLHARILEAKLATASQPGYLTDHSIAGLHFEDSLVPPLSSKMPNGNDGTPLHPWEVNLALNYQLHERLQFVDPPDPVVANLLGDWATLNLAGGPIETAGVLYPLALQYGLPGNPLITARQRYIRQMLARSKKEASLGYGCDICQPVE